ncbi:hypothetical protein [Fodinicola feengrottensis]
MKGQPTPTLRSRTILRGVGRTVWRVWWRSYGWLRRARAGKHHDRLLARRCAEIDAQVRAEAEHRADGANYVDWMRWPAHEFRRQLANYLKHRRFLRNRDDRPA